MRDKYQKIETTFGQIRIYKDLEDNFNFEKKNEKEENNKANLESKETKAEVETNLNNQNFFGINEIKNDNYFDQQLIKEYKINKDLENSKKISVSNENKNISKQHIKKDELNYFDQYYFSNLTEEGQTTYDDNGLQSPVNQFNIKTDDNLIGNIQNFKTNQTKNQQNNEKKTIPIIKSENLTETSSLKNSNINLNLKEKEQEKNESQHKILLNEIPNWENVTIDEAVNILKSHICYHDEEHGILAIDKPYGLPSIKGPNVHLSVSKLLPNLEKKLKLNYRLLMCNRLDENTTGIMLFATNSEIASKIRSYYDERKILKQYLAITKNIPKFSEGEINIPLIRREVNGKTKTYLSPNYNEETGIIVSKPTKDNDLRKNAITRYRILDSNNKSALVEIQPVTGFQHQIRAHLSYGLGCPILGDHKYSHHVKMAPQKLPDEMLKCLKIKQSKARYVPMHLHSSQIILPEFYKNNNIFIKAKLPLHFINNLKRLKLKF